MTSDVSFSVDDLLKLQEERPYKRRRVSPPIASKDSKNDSEDGTEDEDSEEQMQPQKSLDEDAPDGETSDEEEEGLDERHVASANAEISSRISWTGRRSNDDVQQKAVRPEASAPSFAVLGASKSLTASLAIMSIKKPTPVQVACIPPLLQGK